MIVASHIFRCPFCGGVVFVTAPRPGCPDSAAGFPACYLHETGRACIARGLNHTGMLVAAICRGRSPRRGGFAGGPC